MAQKQVVNHQKIVILISLILIQMAIAYAQALLTDQDIWLDIIEMRNLSSYTYDELEIKQFKSKLPTYTEASKILLTSLNEQIDD
jgi:hypothetical protein